MVALAIVWSLAVTPPDILISAEGRNVAVRGEDGRLRLISTSKDSFTVKEWLAADGDGRGSADLHWWRASHATMRAAWSR